MVFATLIGGLFGGGNSGGIAPAKEVATGTSTPLSSNTETKSFSQINKDISNQIASIFNPTQVGAFFTGDQTDKQGFTVPPGTDPDADPKGFGERIQEAIITGALIFAAVEFVKPR